MILIPHITMTTAAHSHPHPSEFSSVFFFFFFWMMSVSVPSKYPSRVPAVKKEQIHVASPRLPPPQSPRAEQSWKTNVVKGAFLLHRCHFKCFFFFLHTQYFV